MNRVQAHTPAHKSRYCTSRALAKCLWVLLLAALTAFLSSCGSSNSSSQQSGPLAGNWQFTMTPAQGSPSSFVGSPTQGGFLLQQNGSVTGQVVFSIVPSANSTAICNSGAMAITGTVSGQTVTLTATINTMDQNGAPAIQTITLGGGQLGTNSAGNATIQGANYSFSIDGYGVVGGQLVPCGLAADAGRWTATSYPSVTGAFQGFFHSTTGGAGISPQDFAVTGNLVQGPNVGESYATLSGTLVFKDAATGENNYPCLATAPVNGLISGNNISLQIYGSNGLVVGQIGTGGPPLANGVVLLPVTVSNGSTGSLVVHGNLGYGLTTKSCALNGGTIGDTGNVCMAFGSSTACTEPIAISPFSTTFLPQVLGSAPTTQTITISNVTSAPLTNVSINLNENDSGSGGDVLFYPQGGDFNGVSNYTVVQTGQANDCTTLAPLGSSFTLATSCQITVQFSPQESCPWLPTAYNTATNPAPPQIEKPSLCPNPLTASLIVNVPNSATEDSDGTFATPISGTGLSAIVPSTGELDFGAEAVGETSTPQTLTFTNQSLNAVQILPGATCNNLNPQTLPFPLMMGSPVSGFQIERTGFPVPPPPNPANPATILNVPASPPTPATVNYVCDLDAGTNIPNFQVVPAGSSCLSASQGVILQPQQTCTLQIAFSPQPAAWNILTPNGSGLDYFLELNTVQCGSGESNCEIDSGRFPVELKTNPPSPLRLQPAAGLEFGTLTKGTPSAPQTITLLNDKGDPNSATITIVSKIASGDYSETDNCPSTLTPTESCPITITFKPSVVGLDYGTLVINYNTPTQFGLAQTVFLRGAGQ